MYLKGKVCTVCHFTLFKNWLKHVFVLTAYVFRAAPILLHALLPAASRSSNVTWRDVDLVQEVNAHNLDALLLRDLGLWCIAYVCGDL